jgi:hypothetical protein
MQVEITVKVDGELVRQHVETVDGTLDQMEEKIHALGQQVACEALQASVDRVKMPRPLFLPKAESTDTKGTRRGLS